MRAEAAWSADIDGRLAGRLNILLVEDNPGDARLIVEALKDVPEIDAEITATARISEAERLLQAPHAFTLILLDLHLDDCEGIECLVRTRNAAPDLPVVVLTGQQDDEQARRYIELGAQDYLIKGETDRDILVRTLRYALSRASIVHHLRQQTEALEAARTELTTRVAERTAELTHLNRAHRALSAANHAVMRAESEQQLLQEVCRVITEIAGYELAWVGIPQQDEATTVRVAAGAGTAAKYLESLRVTWGADSKFGNGPVGKALRERRTVVIRDIELDQGFEPWREQALASGFRSVTGIPLIEEGASWAALAIYSSDGNAFDSAEVTLLKQLGADLSYGMRTLRLRDQHARTLHQLADREQMLHSLVQIAPTLIVLWHPEEGIQLFNRTSETLSGYRSEEVLGKNLIDLFVDDEERQASRETIDRIVATGGTAECEVTCLTRGGEQRRIEWHCTALARPDETNSVLSIGVDITERRQREHQMRQLSSAIEAAAEIVAITNRNGIIEYVNPAFEESSGYSSAEVLGRTPVLLQSGLHDEAFYSDLWQTILGGDTFRAVFMNRRKDGELFYEDKTITPLMDADGEVTHFITTGRNVTKERQAAEQIHLLSSYDALTGLPNRAHFVDRLEQTLHHRKGGDSILATLFLDVDRFKVINETLGHAAGDQLIRDIARRINDCVRGGDILARLGGDEFAILMQNYEANDDVAPFATRILNTFKEPFSIDSKELFVTASVGISQYPADGKDASQLLGRAEEAMYQAKERGKNRFQFYSADTSSRSFEQLSLETSLRKALERDEFVLHFQPQVDIHTGAVEAVEALIRWQHPDLGLVAPADFIPLLEETGLIVPVGEWVLHAAAEQHVAWREAGLPPLEMAINLSALQLHQENLIAVVETILRESGMEARYLELEITESAVMQRIKEVAKLLRSFKAMDIRLTVDDFGTGYSSLSYLTQLPIDALKVDRSFVRNVPDSEQDAEVTQAVVALAHSLRLMVVAEGIETEQQLQFLRSIGCHRAQGFLFSRPVPADQIPALLSAPLMH